MKHRAAAPPSTPPEPTGIVSVNSRRAEGGTLAAKAAFGLMVVALLTAGAVSGYNRFKGSQDQSSSERVSRSDSTAQPAETKPRKQFALSPQHIQPIAPIEKVPEIISPCSDGEPARLLTGPGGQPIPDSAGKPLQVCKDGQLVLSPNTPTLADLTPPSANNSSPQVAPPKVRSTRFDGDVALGSSALLDHGALLRESSDDSEELSAEPPISGRSPARLRRGGPDRATEFDGQSRAVTARFIGDRDMLIPKGRTIDCNLSVRLVTEVSGNATCVLSSHVYSDSGRVVLAERGSTVTGEYAALTEQGQRRIFVLWTRLQTPNGVVIDIDSPAADALGTTGLPGEVNNRWGERIGAAVLLSLVEDAVGYQTARASTSNGHSGPQDIAVFENSTRTGRTLAERILDSTINIKPTVFKQQGDRATIFVNKDLDFRSVYALRAQ